MRKVKKKTNKLKEKLIPDKIQAKKILINR